MSRLTFRALQEAAGTNPSVLNVRLRELREAQSRRARATDGYGLTRQGRELLEHLPAAARVGGEVGSRPAVTAALAPRRASLLRGYGVCARR